MSDADIIIIGGGHNALVGGAYLAKAGLSVLVLEARDVLGGGTVTEALTAPGFLHDSAATGHIGIQFNPAIADNELGLAAHGLRYLPPDPVALVHDEHDRPVAMWLDEERTADQLGGFDVRDAAAYRELLRDWRDVRDVHLARLAVIPGEPDGASPEMAAKWAGLASRSAWDLIHERFVDDRSRLLLLWLAGMSTQQLTVSGSGMLAVALPGMLSQVSWANARGGSIALIDALHAVIVEHGGRVLTGRRVTRVTTNAGAARGVITENGESFTARHAVISAAHPSQLPGLVHPTPLPQEFASLDSWRPGASMFAVHLALPAPPVYEAQGAERAVVTGSAGLSGLRAQFDDLAAGRLSSRDLWLLAACSTHVDATRAPGGAATLKVLTAAPYALDGDPRNWEARAEGYADALLARYASYARGYAPGSEIARTIHTPVDLERWNINNVRGGHQGGEMTPDQMGPNRPVRGWAGYRMPLPGLYQTGSSTHPGGTVGGFAGRNAARVVLTDLGIDPATVMGDRVDSTRTLKPAALTTTKG